MNYLIIITIPKMRTFQELHICTKIKTNADQYIRSLAIQTFMLTGSKTRMIFKLHWNDSLSRISNHFMWSWDKIKYNNIPVIKWSIEKMAKVQTCRLLK